jgi:hypothetical protein
LDDFWIRRIDFDLFAEEDDALIERAGVREIVGASAGIEEGIAGNGFAAVTVEQAQHGNIAWGELDGRISLVVASGIPAGRSPSQVRRRVVCNNSGSPGRSRWSFAAMSSGKEKVSKQMEIFFGLWATAADATAPVWDFTNGSAGFSCACSRATERSEASNVVVFIAPPACPVSGGEMLKDCQSFAQPFHWAAD